MKSIQAILRLTGVNSAKIEAEIPSRKQLLLRVSERHDFKELIENMDQLAEKCHQIFNKVIEFADFKKSKFEF